MVQYFRGAVMFQSSLQIEELGKEISKYLFGGLSFSGVNTDFYDETPVVYIETHILGLRIMLCGNQGIDGGEIYVFDDEVENYYILDINDLYINTSLESIFPKEELKATDIDDYLEGLLRYHFSGDSRFKFVSK